MAVAAFSEHVDRQMREALQHQRFPVRAIDYKSSLRESGQASNRVVINFIPATHTGYLGEAEATGTLTHAGPVDVGLVFFGEGDELFLGTVGPGQFFSNCDVRDLARRLEHVLLAMSADPSRQLSSIDVLDEGEHACLDALGNRLVLSESGFTPVSIPVLFAARMAESPDAVALVCEGSSMTYRELTRRRIGWRICWRYWGGAGKVCGAAVFAFR